MDSEDDFIIPFPKARCNCRHYKKQHARGEEKCDNCNCRRFRLNTSLTEAEAKELEESEEWEKLKRQTRMEQAREDLRGEMCVLPDSVVEAATPIQTSNKTQKPVDDYRGSTVELSPVAQVMAGITPDSGLKDSGQRLLFASGMVRDVDDTKPAFDLVIPEGIPYKELMLTRWAELLRKGAIKYSRRNWEKANSNDELDRAKASAFRHFMQWFSDETDEDHAAAVFFNINEVETIRYKQKKETA